MSTVKITPEFTNAVKEAVLFGNKTGCSASKNYIILRFEEGSLTVISCGASWETFSRRIESTYRGEELTVCFHSDSFSRLMETMESETEAEPAEEYLSFGKGRTKAKIYSSDSEISNAVLSGMERSLPSPDSADIIIPLGILRKGIKEVIYAKADSGARSSYATSGVTVRCGDGKAEIYAVDSARAALFSTECETCETKTCVIPAEIALFIISSKWTGIPEDSPCRINIKENRFGMAVGEVTILSPTISGSIYRLDSTMKAGNGYISFTVSADDLSRTLDRIISVAPSEAGTRAGANAVLSLCGENLSLTYSGVRGEISEVLSTVTEESRPDETGRFAVNAKYLRESLNAFQNQPLRMSADFSSSGRPLIMTPYVKNPGTERVHILLPVVLSSRSC